MNDITVVVVTATGCGGCEHFKLLYSNQLTSTLEKLGIKSYHFNAKNIKFGITPEEAKYKFLTAINIFPFIFIIDDETLKKSDDLPNTEVFKNIFAFNANIDITSSGNIIIQPINTYEYNDKGYRKFITDYLERDNNISNSNNDKIITNSIDRSSLPKSVAPLVNVASVSTPMSYGLKCGKYTPINTYEIENYGK